MQTLREYSEPGYEKFTLIIVNMKTTNSGPGNTKFAFILIANLFSHWGFSNNRNPFLIPHLKKSFTLTPTT